MLFSPKLGMLFAVAALLGGCAAAGRLPPDATLDKARHGVIRPTAEYALPDGGTRLEFVHGGMSRVTFMLDFDAKGHLVSQQQVLTEATFKTIVPGTPANEVLMRIGHPTEFFDAGWVDRYHVWNYRFVGGDCLVFQVSIAAKDERVISAGIADDLACARGDNRQ